jgi:hypothetical protein
MRVDELTPLSTVPAFDAATRQKLAAYWITTAEEFLATARMRNPLYTSGLGAMGTMLGYDDAAMHALFQAAQAAAPTATSFDISVARDDDYPGGLILDDVADTAVAFRPSLMPVPDTSPLPPAVSLIARFPPVGDQGQRATCVAFTLVAMYQCLSGDMTDLSEQFLFWLCKEHDHLKHDPRGTRADIGAAVLRDIGLCAETVWPYNAHPAADEQNVGQGPPPNEAMAHTDAQRRRISGYTLFEHPHDLGTLKASLAAAHPVLIGISYQTHWSRSRQATLLGRIRPALPGEPDVGDHAMCLVGYRDDPSAPGGGYFIVRNSWGPGWASENPDGPGYAHIPYAVLRTHTQVALVLDGVQTPVAQQEPINAEARYQTALAAAITLEAADQARLITALATRLAQAVDTPTPSTPGVASPAPPPAGTWFDAVEREENPLAWLVPNGIDPTLGRARYRFDLAGARSAATSGHWQDDDSDRHLHARRDGQDQPTFGLVHGFNYDELAVSQQGAGWGVVVCAQDNARLLTALWPLLQLRCEQQGFALPPEPHPDEHCGAWLRRVVGDAYVNRPLDAARPVPVFLYDASRGEGGETYNQWVARHGIGADAGAVDPRRGVPFYLLLVGRPGPRFANDPHIPFHLQYDLDLFWGVGRLCFTDLAGQHRYAAYTTYAEAVVRAETGAMSPRARELAYFGPRHHLDRATALSTTELIDPLLRGTDGTASLASRFTFTTRAFLEAQATRSSLATLFQGRTPAPAVLFSASHGIDLPRHHPDLIAQQGALLCHDWDGLGSPRRDHWFTGDDLPAEANVAGLIAVVFACFGVGCPAHDSFRIRQDTPPAHIAPHAFVAQLPQRLLERGALAVVGHVDRAWSYAFRDEILGVPRQTQSFEDLLGRVLDGKRLGEATDQFNTRQGASAMRLTELLDKYRYAQGRNPVFELERIGPRWVAFSDARAYALLGDPAVRIVTTPADHAPPVAE